MFFVCFIYFVDDTLYSSLSFFVSTITCMFTSSIFLTFDHWLKVFSSISVSLFFSGSIIWHFGKFVSYSLKCLIYILIYALCLFSSPLQLDIFLFLRVIMCPFYIIFNWFFVSFVLVFNLLSNHDLNSNIEPGIYTNLCIPSIPYPCSLKNGMMSSSRWYWYSTVEVVTSCTCSFLCYYEICWIDLLISRTLSSLLFTFPMYVKKLPTHYKDVLNN